MLALTGLSFAHPAVDANRRAELTGPIRDARHRLAAAGHDAFFLTTCLRLEVMWIGDPASVSDVSRLLYGEVVEDGTLRHDDDAFRHLCRVAAGLDSPLVGEPEVLGQFRQAVAEVQDAVPDSHPLNRVLTAAVGAARSARKMLDDVPRGSLAAVAAEQARDSGRVAVLGAGAMARAAVDNLAGVEVAVFGRRPGTVAGLTVRPWESVAGALAEFPVVISTVPGKTTVVPHEVVDDALSRRRSDLKLIDLGMPPGFPKLQGVVDYSGVDDLAVAATQSTPTAAEERVATEAAAAWRRITANDKVGSVIAALLDRADQAVDEEARRFAAKLAAAEDPEAVLRQAVHTVARRVLHPAVAYLSTTDEVGLDKVAEAFGVSE